MSAIVIGGGAAGFFAAIVYAEASHEPVQILEKGQDVLSKVRISGGGRCNVTHACYEPKQLTSFYPRGERELQGPFTRFQPRDTVRWFEEHGVSIKTEKDGRMFPATDRSQTIVDCLRTSAEKAGVLLRLNAQIKDIVGSAKGFEVFLKDGAQYHADHVLLATGSNREGYRWAEKLGHTIVSPVPSLFTFEISDPRLKNLAGQSVADAHVQLESLSLEQRGPVLITHWGLSGPAILRLSAWGARELHDRNYQTILRVNWLPDQTEEMIRKKFAAAREEAPTRTVWARSPFSVISQRLWERFLQSSGISPIRKWSELTRVEMDRLIETLQAMRLAIHGKGIFKDEFVTCGGVRLDEVHFQTMESKRRPGLYFAGEVLDIDAVTGGFNFQNAWTTGFLAGQAMARQKD